MPGARVHRPRGVSRWKTSEHNFLGLPLREGGKGRAPTIGKKKKYARKSGERNPGQRGTMPPGIREKKPIPRTDRKSQRTAPHAPKGQQKKKAKRGE